MTDMNPGIEHIGKYRVLRELGRGATGAVYLAEDSLDEHAYDTISGGDWLCDQDAVELFVKEAPLELMQLEHWGCPWSREADGHIGVRPFGGMKKTRTWYAADKTGFHMLHTLFQTSLKYDAVVRYDEHYVTKLLVDDGRVQGVVAIELTTGKIQAITAKAVILCTGGGGRVFRFTTNASICTGPPPSFSTSARPSSHAHPSAPSSEASPLWMTSPSDSSVSPLRKSEPTTPSANATS